MGFMDKAKKLVEQAQQEAKDGTLKERAKALADQAQAKLDEVQGQFNDRNAGKTPTDGAPAGPPAPAPAAPADPPVPAPAAAAPPSDPAPAAGAVDRDHETPPKVTGGDPLAG